MILSIVSAALLASASPTAVAASDAPAAEKKVCKREKQIGSMVRVKKICRTKAEWNEIAERSRSELESGQRHKSFPGG